MIYQCATLQVALFNSDMVTMVWILHVLKATRSQWSLSAHGRMLWCVPRRFSISCKSLNFLQAIGNRRGRGLLPFEIVELVDLELRKPKFTSECTPAYLETIREFVVQHIAHHL